jgi:hypothetical protein
MMIDALQPWCLDNILMPEAPNYFHVSTFGPSPSAASQTRQRFATFFLNLANMSLV